MAGAEAESILSCLSPAELQAFIEQGGQVVYRQLGGTEQVFAFCFLGLELICFLLIIILFSFMDVEGHIADDQKRIRERQQAARATGAAN